MPRLSRLSLLLTALHSATALYALAQEPVLARDVDKRPLPVVSRASLSPAVQKAVQAMEADQRKDFGDSGDRATPPQLGISIQRIPVAPHDHKLYLVTMSGEMGCTGNGPNCRTAVLDETAAGVTAVDDNGFADVAVVRRPKLQMPDIAFYEQEGHFATSIMVYRLSDGRWKPYLCKMIDPINDDPSPEIVADRACTP